ncbi:aminotransferase class V-fold PLP-dependent enzyme, partial [Gracilibacillus oryzae]
ESGSLYNTPPTYGIYMAKLVFEWIKELGGIKAIQKRNEEKADLLYNYIAHSDFYASPVAEDSRSIMNIPFIIPGQDLDAQFVKEAKEAKEAGLETLKGHRSVGGMRASIYNAMPVEGVEALVDFMKKFEEEHK